MKNKEWKGGQGEECGKERKTGWRMRCGNRNTMKNEEEKEKRWRMRSRSTTG